MMFLFAVRLLLFHQFALYQRCQCAAEVVPAEVDGTCENQQTCGSSTSLSGFEYFTNWTAMGTAEGSDSQDSEKHHIWKGKELRGVLSQIRGGERVNSTLHVAKHILPGSLTASFMSSIAQAEFDHVDKDTIDGDPTFEHYIVKHGSIVDKGMFSEFKPFLKKTCLPYIARTLKCKTCTVCDILVRRYLPQERRGVKVHQDIYAYATAIITLNSEAFSGGYFVVRGEHEKAQTFGKKPEQLFLQLETGDLLLHNYEILHGVNVTQGSRYSVVLWFKDRKGVCKTDETPWYPELAEQGNIDAGFRAAQSVLTRNLDAQDPDMYRARRWLENAAQAGNIDAMMRLSQMLHFGQGGAKDVPGAVKWLRRASELGRRDAMAVFAWYLEMGVGCTKDRKEARSWYEKAAAMGHPGAQQWVQKNR